MPNPKDPTKLPAWWRPAIRRPRSVYDVFGHTTLVNNKTVTIVALDVVEAAMVATQQFYFSTVLSVTLKLEAVWTPEHL